MFLFNPSGTYIEIIYNFTIQTVLMLQNLSGTGKSKILFLIDQASWNSYLGKGDNYLMWFHKGKIFLNSLFFNPSLFL
mgnify:CR=1 FL=1